MDIIIIVLILISHFFSLAIQSLTYQIVIPEKRSSTQLLIYRIETFDQIFDLKLIQSERFLLSSFTFQLFHQNQTLFDENDYNNKCFYQGYVNNDFSSILSISTCHGLFGMFIYEHVEYFIEPKIYRNKTLWNFEHLLYTNTHYLMKTMGHCPVEGKSYFEEKQYPHYTRKKRQPDLDPSAKHVEILVAYDDSLKDFHSNIDVRSYILTLFNYVSQLYSDASIGNNIKIWVVKLVELGRELSNYLESTSDAGDILNRFCQWQKNNNHPGTYDAGVLLTRIRLCNKRTNQSMETKCDTLGLTELGTMCNLTSSCAVVRDNGFATAFTIAHEIAHLFGIRHDNDKICLNWNEEQNLMATSLLFDHNHYKWSNCSRFYFTQYFESNRYPCVNNIPNEELFLLKNRNDVIRELPGYSSNLNIQCQRAFGIDFEYCKDLSHTTKCARLYCRQKYSSLAPCITNHAHWSDGSLCSESEMEIKRCFRGQCRNVDDLKPRHGNWGQWQPWSPCTRTCGSAVKKSQRFCDNPRPEYGGKYCSGSSTRLESCDNNPPCENSLDISRQLQCSRYNNRSINSILPSDVRFEPKYNVLPQERCKLICKISDDPLERSFIFNDRVDDGTPCSQDNDNQDICIQGVCVSFGCDYKYGSNATEDMCGVCNGQNQTCQLFNGRKIISQKGITNIVQIPLHTTRVRIIEISSRKDQYYLAMKDINGTYVLNGLQHLQLYPIKFRLYNSTISYTGTESNNETILIIGRLTLPIDIQIISMNHQSERISTEVYWEYYAPINEELNECSRPCQGVKTVKHCRIYGKKYELIYCLMFNIPFEYQSEQCNNHCILNWTKIDQQICSTRCGNGFKHVLYQCIKQGLNIEIINDEICRKYLGEKPKNIQSCIGNCTGTGWVYGKWSECYDNDGTCIRKRSVQCRNSSNLVVANINCHLEFIFDTEQCSQIACTQQKSMTCTDECSTPYWRTFAWQKCTATCSLMDGFHHRRVVCFYKGLPVSNNYCNQRLKPIDKKSCTRNASCAKWFVSPWSSCSVTCGIGIQHRRVLCKNQDVVVSIDKCDTMKKPRVLRRCRKRTCQKIIPIWLTDDWTKCDHQTCLQTRTIRCIDSIARSNLSIDNCIKKQIQPLIQRICQISDCLEWRVAHWHGCPVKCGFGIEFGSGYSCYTRQKPIKRLNINQCEAVRPQLNKPLLRRICRRHCPDWRSGDWNEITVKSTSSKDSFSLLYLSIFIIIQIIIHSLENFLVNNFK